MTTPKPPLMINIDDLGTLVQIWLKGRPPQHLAWLAGRAALRVLPSIHCGNEERAAVNTLGVLRAVNAALWCSTSNDASYDDNGISAYYACEDAAYAVTAAADGSTDSAAAFAAKAASRAAPSVVDRAADAASAASNDPPRSSAFFKARVAAAEAARGTYRSAAFAARAADNETTRAALKAAAHAAHYKDHSIQQAVLVDLGLLAQPKNGFDGIPLWGDGIHPYPDWLPGEEAKFAEFLQQHDFYEVFWPQYQKWCRGEYDLAWMERLLNIDENIAAVPKLAIEYLK